jgi:hypothetical protein
MSTSPFSNSARRVLGEAIWRKITFRNWGSAPDFHSSKRVNTVCWSGVQDSILKAPPPASLRETQSSAQGSAAVACFLARAELTITGTGTTRSGMVSLFGLSKTALKVCASTTEN